MKRTAVDSSCLASVGYDAERRVLELEFTSGSIYRYTQVARRVHQQLMAADSHGTYFNEHIKDRYVFTIVRAARL